MEEKKVEKINADIILGGEDLKPSIDVNYIKETRDLDLKVTLNLDETLEFKITLEKDL